MPSQYLIRPDMDTLTTYKIPRRIKPDLLLLPPYCRRAEKDKSRDVLEMAQLRLEVSDPSKILSLCETLTDDNTRALEVKLNKYVSKRFLVCRSFIKNRWYRFNSFKWLRRGLWFVCSVIMELIDRIVALFI